MWDLTDCKLILVSLALVGILTLFSAITTAIVPWLATTFILQLIITAILTGGTLVALYVKLQLFEEVEDEIIEELTIHQDVLLFRVSFLLGIFLMVAIGKWLNFTWIFQLAIASGGIFVWLYFMDVMLELILNAETSLWDILDEVEHTLRMLGLGGIILLLGTVVSFWQYDGLRVKIPVESVTQSPSYSERLQQFFRSLQKDWRKNSRVDQPLDEMLENVEPAKMRKWLQKLKKQHADDPEWQNFVTIIEQYVDQKSSLPEKGD